MKVEKVPELTCKNCGGFRVMMTDDGPECSDCDAETATIVNLSTEIEYLIYELRKREADM